MSILLEWLGADGSTWNLRDGAVRLAASGTGGLGFPKLTTFTRQSSVLDGQVVTGWRAEPREFPLPLKLGYPGWSALAWRDIQAAWWASCRPDKSGTLRVTRWDGGQRTLPCRLVADDYVMDYDPDDMGLEDLPLSLVADVPWWLGSAVGAQFGTGAGGNFLGPGGLGPPFTIALASSTGSQVVSNPGDLDAWPTWTLTGPLSSFTLNVAGQVVQSGALLTLAAGQSLTISTDPGVGQTAIREDGSNVTRYLSSYGFAPIPAGGSTAVTVATVGTGSASLSLVPRYFRAW